MAEGRSQFDQEAEVIVRASEEGIFSQFEATESILYMVTREKF